MEILAEVYQIIYYGPDDKLRGLIACNDEKNRYQCLFKDKDLDTSNMWETMVDYITAEDYREADKQLDVGSMPLIKSGDFIMLSGPTKASINAKSGFGLSLYLFGIIHEYLSVPKYPMYENPEIHGVPSRKFILGDDGRRCFMVLYAIFDNAVEAHVKVKFTNVNSAFDLYGMITARTSAITEAAYSSILFFKDEADEKVRVEPEKELILQLSRPFVALPLGSQLILQFGLCVDGNENMFDTLTFDAREVTNSRHDIFYSKAVIQVEVSWRWKVNLSEYESPEDF